MREGVGLAAHLRHGVLMEKGRPGDGQADAGQGGVWRVGPKCRPLADNPGVTCATVGVQLRRISGREGGRQGWARPAEGGNLTSTNDCFCFFCHLD